MWNMNILNAELSWMAVGYVFSMANMNMAAQPPTKPNRESKSSTKQNSWILEYWKLLAIIAYTRVIWKVLSMAL